MTALKKKRPRALTQSGAKKSGSNNLPKLCKNDCTALSEQNPAFKAQANHFELEFCVGGAHARLLAELIGGRRYAE